MLGNFRAFFFQSRPESLESSKLFRVKAVVIALFFEGHIEEKTDIN